MTVISKHHANHSSLHFGMHACHAQSTQPHNYQPYLTVLHSFSLRFDHQSKVSCKNTPCSVFWKSFETTHKGCSAPWWIEVCWFVVKQTATYCVPSDHFHAHTGQGLVQRSHNWTSLAWIDTPDFWVLPIYPKILLMACRSPGICGFDLHDCGYQQRWAILLPLERSRRWLCK